ncbi:MAG: tetratricopeptide repeat protein [Bacteroidia bacterium]|nr:tetratricopeptide repeat protein [Bacteroidia bacterium]
MTPKLFLKSIFTFLLILITHLSFAQSENYKTAYEAYKNGESKKALEYFEKDINENPNSAYSHYYLSVMKVIEENLDIAENHIDKALMYFPDSSTTMRSKSYVIKGDIAYKLKNTVNTFKYYALAIQLRPKEIDLYLDRGQYYFELGQLDKAEADFKHILTIDVSNIYAYGGLGRNYLKEKRYDLAEKNLTKAIQLNDLYYVALQLRAQTYFEQKKYKEAILDMVEVISIEPDDSDSRDQFLTYSLNDYELALTELNEKSKNAPFNEYWNTTKARLYAMHGKFRLAIKEFNQLIKYMGSENSIDYLITKRATAYENAGLYDKAIEDYNHLITNDSTNAVLFSQRANAYRHAGDYQKAIQDLNASMVLDPEDYWNHYMRGWIYVEMLKETDKALEDFDTAVTLNPEDAYTRLMRGKLLLEKRNEKEKAIEDFNLILSLEKEIKEEENCKQYALFHLNKKSEALQWMKEIIDKYPSEGNYYEAACLYALMNKKEEALNALEISFKKGNTNFNHISIDDDLDNVKQMPEYISLYNKWFEKFKTENN